MPPLYFFNWPSLVGGADTKFAHLLPLLRREAEVTVVPNKPERLVEPGWKEWVESLGVKVRLLEQLPERLEGWAVSLCNADFFEKGIWNEVQRRGLKIAWSSEMMWHFRAELGAVMFGWINAVLYVSPVQRAALEPGYLHALSGGTVPLTPARLTDPDAVQGVLRAENGQTLRWAMPGNYIDPVQFPFRQRGNSRRPFTIGRLSRPDPDKFPDNFPASYEGLGLRNPCRYRVMAWSERLHERWAEHEFDSRWELLPQAAEPTVDFLHSLDVLVYEVSPRFSESWGRAVVEAMLTGAVPLIPSADRHHLRNLVPHGVAGFHCDGQADYARYARWLQDEPDRLAEMSRAARHWSESRLCDAAEHLARWRAIFTQD
jgi:hypothetical protein